jgi:hypothetical protein
MIRLNGYEFRFHREAADFIPDPKFKPFFWKQKDDDVDEDTRNDGTGKDHESSFRRASTLATSMDVDSTQVAGAVPKGNSANLFSKPSVNHVIAVTSFNPSPRTPRGVEIVERARRLSPNLFADGTCVP